jgi:hypothetical protein
MRVLDMIHLGVRSTAGICAGGVIWRNSMFKKSMGYDSYNINSLEECDHTIIVY